MIIPFHFSGVETVFSKNTRHFHVADQGELTLRVSVLCPIEVAILLLWHLFPLVSMVTAHAPHSRFTLPLDYVCSSFFPDLFCLSPEILSSTWPFSYIALCSCPEFRSLNKLLGCDCCFRWASWIPIWVKSSKQSLCLFSVHPPPATIQQLPGVNIQATGYTSPSASFLTINQAKPK